jgi:hypothetical protein
MSAVVPTQIQLALFQERNVDLRANHRRPCASEKSPTTNLGKCWVNRGGFGGCCQELRGAAKSGAPHIGHNYNSTLVLVFHHTCDQLPLPTLARNVGAASAMGRWCRPYGRVEATSVLLGISELHFVRRGFPSWVTRDALFGTNRINPAM